MRDKLGNLKCGNLINAKKLLSFLTLFGQGKVAIFLHEILFLTLYVTCSRFRREAFQAPRNYYCELLAGKASQAGFLGLFKKNEKKARRSPEKYLIQNCKNSIDLNATHNYCQENFLARLSSKTSNRPYQCVISYTLYYKDHIIWVWLHRYITLLKAGYCHHPDLCNFSSCTMHLDKMFTKANELMDIEASNIDLDTCTEIPAWRYWHLVVPFLLGLGNIEIIVLWYNVILFTV